MGTQPRKGYARVEVATTTEDAAPAPVEPTMEQLERCALLLGLALLPEGLRPPYYRESLLNLHRLLQRTADGDEDAARTLAAIKRSFGATAAAPSPTISV